MKKNNSQSYINSKVRFYKRNLNFLLLLFLFSIIPGNIIVDSHKNLKINIIIYFIILAVFIIFLTILLLIYLNKKWNIFESILNSNDFLELINSEKPTKLILDEIHYSVSIFDLLNQDCYEVISTKYKLFYNLLKFKFSKKMDNAIHYFYKESSDIFDKKEYKYNEKVYLLSEKNPHTQIIIDFTNKTFLLLNELINEYLVDGTNSEKYQNEISKCFISFGKFYKREEEFYIEYLSAKNYNLIDENLISKSHRLQEALKIVNEL